MRIFWLGTWATKYRNVGDQAQVAAIRHWFNDNFPSSDVYFFTRLAVINYLDEIAEHVNEDDLVFLHSGGDFGSVYNAWHKVRRLIIEAFPDNIVVQLPVTVSYDYYVETGKYKRVEGEEKKVLKEDQQFFDGRDNFVLCARDATSFEIAKENLNCKTLLVPDFALYWHPPYRETLREGALFVTRIDIERRFTELGEIQSITKSLYDRFGSFNWIRNIAASDISNENRELIIGDYLSEYARHKVTVTSRLHGLVFSAVTDTPCVVFSSGIPHKITGEIPFVGSPVNYCESIECLNEALDNILDLKHRKIDVKKFFNELATGILGI